VIVNTKLLTKMVLREFYELVAAAEVSTCPPSPSKRLSLNSYRKQLLFSIKGFLIVIMITSI